MCWSYPVTWYLWIPNNHASLRRRILDFHKFEGNDNKTFLQEEVKLRHTRTPLERTVAPALHPVSTESDWVILESPVMLINVLPQKSLEALGYQWGLSPNTISKRATRNFTARFGASKSNGGTRPMDIKVRLNATTHRIWKHTSVQAAYSMYMGIN